MGSIKSLEKYNPLLKEAYQEREAGLKELAELRARRVSEQNAAKDDPSSLDKDSKKATHNEMPLTLPMTHGQFKEVIGKVKVKPEPLVINGIEHLGIIHDLLQTDDPRIFRFFGDRYIATVSFEHSPPIVLGMKEIPDRNHG